MIISSSLFKRLDAESLEPVIDCLSLNVVPLGNDQRDDAD